MNQSNSPITIQDKDESSRRNSQIVTMRSTKAMWRSCANSRRAQALALVVVCVLFLIYTTVSNNSMYNPADSWKETWRNTMERKGPLITPVTETTVWDRILARQTNVNTNYMSHAVLQQEINNLHHNFKVYTYVLEPFGDLRLVNTQCGINAGNNKGYGLERHMAKVLQQRGPFTTSDPKDADMYYVPLLPCVARWELRWKGIHRDDYEKNVEFAKEYLKRGFSHVMTDFPFWSRTDGKDHFWTSSHDGGITRAELAPASATDNPVIIVNSADETRGFDPCKDISGIPNIDFARPNVGRGGDGLTQERNRLAFFAGNLQNVQLRKNFAHLFSDHPQFDVFQGRLAEEEYTDHLATHTFCIHMRGHQVWSPRVIEYLWFGCIPVILSDDYHLPLGNILDWREFAVILCEDDMPHLSEILESISEDQISKMQNRLKEVWEYFVYHQEATPGDATWMTILQLYQRYRGTLECSKSVRELAGCAARPLR
eukprot:Clim_evm20s166 gene=Clim_evmTU20s166